MLKKIKNKKKYILLKNNIYHVFNHTLIKALNIGDCSTTFYRQLLHSTKRLSKTLSNNNYLIS